MIHFLRAAFFCGLACAWGACGGSSPRAQDADASGLAAASRVIDEAESGGAFDERLAEISRLEDPQIRSRAARALARIGDARGCPIVAELSRDPDPDVVVAALFAAGALAPDLCPFVARTITLKLRSRGHTKEELSQALESAGRLGARAPWEELVGWAARGSRTTRVAALEALGLAAPELEEGAEEIAAVAEKALFEEHVELRAAAAFALSRWLPVLPGPLGDRMAEHLGAIAGGGAPRALRGGAAAALADAGRLSPKIVRVLVEQAPEAAARALARYAGQDCGLAVAALPPLVGRLQGEACSGSPKEAEDLLSAARAALSRACPDAKSAAKSLDDLLSGDSPCKEARGAGIVRCLSRFVSGAGDISLLACDPAHPLAGQQLLAARLAGRAATDRGAWRSLMEMTESDSPEVMVAAISALGGIPHEPSREVLKEMAAGPRRLAAKAATRALVLAKIPAPRGEELAPEVRPISAAEKHSRRGLPARVQIRTTRGKITAQLFVKTAPAGAAAFIENAKRGVFVDSPVWSVEPRDFVRAGDPTGTGLVDASGWIPWEISEIPFEAGTLGLESRAGLSSRARFFICLDRHPELDGQKTALGRVTEGLEVALALSPEDEILSVEVLP